MIRSVCLSVYLDILYLGGKKYFLHILKNRDFVKSYNIFHIPKVIYPKSVDLKYFLSVLN